MRSLDASTTDELEPTATILTELHEAASRQDIQIMVVGAAARDILIRHVIGSPPDRATKDIDIAVAVSSWPDLNRLTAGLRPENGSVHTFLVLGQPVDVIPFGDIESDQRTITWPNDHLMDVFGFQEALAAAIDVTLPSGVTIPVASLPAQSLLKLFAWRDRRYLTRRDATDLRTIIRAYSQGPYHDELFNEHEDLLARHDFDPDAAGAERMGHEAAALIAPDDRPYVTSLLYSADLFAELVGDMGGAPGTSQELLTAYRDGFAT